MIKVHPEQIPESDSNAMARSLFSILSEFYEDPKNKQEFEDWKKQKGKAG